MAQWNSLCLLQSKRIYIGEHNRFFHSWQKGNFSISIKKKVFIVHTYINKIYMYNFSFLWTVLEVTANWAFIDRLNSGNFEIFYPSEFNSIISGRVKSVLKIIQNDTNFGYYNFGYLRGQNRRWEGSRSWHHQCWHHKPVI